MRVLFADLETFSTIKIAHGVHKYAEEAEILLFTYAFDNGPVQCWDCIAQPLIPKALADALADEGTTLVFHNVHFDRTILQHCGYPLPIERFHCTMAQALAHSLPGALGALGDILGLAEDQIKQKHGRYLINLFCKPRPKTSKIPRASRDTHPAEWSEFIDYAKADIIAMRAVYAKLPKWNYQKAELALWQLDQTINNRGVAVDLALARGAIRATEKAQASLAAQTFNLTFGEVVSATQRDKLLKHIVGAYGVTLPDMQINTLERRIEDVNLPQELRELLAIRLQASKTSASKYKRVVESSSRDGRLRGLLQFCGAMRTGRWSGRLFQPQNLPRPTHKQALIDQGIQAMKLGIEDLLFDDVIALAGSAIRGVIIAPANKKLVVADLANIEGRVLAWLAGEEWKIQAFREYDAGTGVDLYALAYAKSFHITPEEVMWNKNNGDGSLRQIGKVQELALGYEGGVGAFATFSMAYGIDLEQMAEAAYDSISDDTKREALGSFHWAEKNDCTYALSERAYVVCDSFKRLWREAHPNIQSFWREVAAKAKAAINNSGNTYECRKLKLRRDGNWLRVVLPSGRALCYPCPGVNTKGEISYMGVNQYTRKWGRISTYGGKLVENITQAVSRDVLAYGMMAAEAANYEIVLTVHDEIIAEAPNTPEFNARQLAELMAIVPSWATGLPLSAAGFESYAYRKD